MQRSASVKLPKVTKAQGMDLGAAPTGSERSERAIQGRPRRSVAVDETLVFCAAIDGCSGGG